MSSSIADVDFFFKNHGYKPDVYSRIEYQYKT